MTLSPFIASAGFARLTPARLKDLEQQFQGSRQELARYLGISERTLFRKLAAIKKA